MADSAKNPYADKELRSLWEEGRKAAVQRKGFSEGLKKPRGAKRLAWISGWLSRA